MLALKNFFSGTATIVDTGPSGNEMTYDITIGSVSNVNKTMFFFTVYHDQDVSYARSYPSIYLLNSTTLRVQWRNVYGQTFTRYVQWYVLEFTEGVYVQHYYSAAKPSSTISIDAVDINKSFIIPSWGINPTSSEGGSEVAYTGANFQFASPSSVTLTNGGTTMEKVSMQVVQWDGAWAQHSLSTIDTTTEVDTTIYDVNLNRAVLFATNNWTSASEPSGIDQIARCNVKDEYTLQMTVFTTGYTQNIATSIVTIPQFKVQRGKALILNANYTQTVSIASVNTAKSIPWVCMPNRPWAQRNDSALAFYHGTHANRLTFDSATQFTTTRGRPWSDIQTDWQVMEFEPPPPRGIVSIQDPGIF